MTAAGRLGSFLGYCGRHRWANGRWQGKRWMAVPRRVARVVGGRSTTERSPVGRTPSVCGSGKAALAETPILRLLVGDRKPVFRAPAAEARCPK
jgi:hypothetical protein